MGVTLIASFEEVSAEAGGGYTAYVEGFREGKSLADARENLIVAVEVVLDMNRRLAEPTRQGTRVVREAEVRVA